MNFKVGKSNSINEELFFILNYGNNLSEYKLA